MKENDSHHPKNDHGPKELTPMQRMLNVWAVVLIIWAVYRHQFETTLPIWLDEFIVKPLIMLAPLAYYIGKYEKKTFFKAVGFTRKNLGTDVGLGLFIGAVIFFAGAIANFLTDGTIVSTDSAWLNQYPIWYLILIASATAFSEQILMQGFLLNRLLKYGMHPFKAIASAMSLFIFLRIPMLFVFSELDGYALLQILSTDLFLIGVVSLLFYLRRNVLLPIIVHACYMVGLYLFL